MQVASMNHSSGRHGRELELQHHQLDSHYAYAQSRTYHSHPQAYLQNHYSNSHGIALDYGYQTRSPQSPPSPPGEDLNKPSLPSISSLLHIADGERTSFEAAQAQQLQQAEQQPNPLMVQTENNNVQSFGQGMVDTSRVALPPTPPMRPDSVADGNQSPSTISTHSSVSAPPYYLGQAMNNMEPHHQRQMLPHVATGKRHSEPSQPSMSPYTTSPYGTSPYGASPGPTSATSYYSPETPMYTPSNMYQQRPLPSNFPPPTVAVASSAGSATGTTNPWQHHHYISASSQAAFPQSQDRYICQTCQKAFSRPSSLRIHSHSHTGEKPYKCPHPGCGKAFSVRSNMKRHERGCHAGNGTGLSIQ
ncbi:hypothetical protein K402DRAFT_17397 [Aulographum hederae CBS 113979]|uniref:C2H2-type domain-containing protein n=1 Tax=Aulographum hederae CBS 113979 TaxID=1176131 RepID=A0A6G1H7M3_9PEZI|nr:hypothetical protein K402DRAFT_17397 [Aulographum hederae CBS 113979]